MLVFFIHGVATHNVQYADKLKSLIKKEFLQGEKPLPHFYSSFWGDVLRDVGKIWNWIHQDLQEVKKDHPQTSIDNIFRYQKFREGFLSEFFGDFLSYLNPERGATIRRLIAQQLEDFLEKNPEETELHIIAHSLGSVILWDVLFSETFSSEDPAYAIRSMINGFSQSIPLRRINLKSITTMGSPILFLNTMLEVNPEKFKQFVNGYKNESLKWINIIHSSDIVAYPLRSSLKLNSTENLVFQDRFISTDANLAEKAARTVGQLDTALVLGVADAHVGYWQCQQTARLVIANISREFLQDVVNRLNQVPGMARPLMSDLRLNFIDETLEEISFKDGSGKLILVVNPLRVHNVWVFDRYENCKFRGYVGLIHGEGLKKEVALIKESYC
jgi:hypothetical protein